MAEPPSKPVLQKPPGYRGPAVQVQPAPRPMPRKMALPPSFRPKKKRRSCCRICCCIFCILIFVLILLLLVLAGTFYLWFDPKLPVFHLQSFRIPTFKVTVKPDGTYLTSQTVARVEMRNPNGKITYNYGGIHVGVTIGENQETELGSVSLPDFTQEKKNTTSIKAEINVKDQLIDDGLGSRLKARYRSKELVANVEVRMGVKLGVERWKIGTVGVNVRGGGVSLKQLDGGVMPKCTINLLKWINIH